MPQRTKKLKNGDFSVYDYAGNGKQVKVFTVPVGCYRQEQARKTSLKPGKYFGYDLSGYKRFVNINVFNVPFIH